MRRNDPRSGPDDSIDEGGHESPDFTTPREVTDEAACPPPGGEDRPRVDRDAGDPRRSRWDPRFRDDFADGVGDWRDVGLATLLMAVGAVLFVVPEPATSGVGIVLVTVGTVVWIIDLLLREP